MASLSASTARRRTASSPTRPRCACRISCGRRRWAALLGAMRDDTKYVALPVPELYDLSSDPGERENVVGTQPARRDGARAALVSFQSTAPAIARSAESAENRERLRSLGYAGG